jgi:hypothetical protein
MKGHLLCDRHLAMDEILVKHKETLFKWWREEIRRKHLYK